MKFKVIKIRVIEKRHPLLNPIDITYDLRSWASHLKPSYFIKGVLDF